MCVSYTAMSSCVLHILYDVYVYACNKAVYEHEKTANLQEIDGTGGFQL